jgi:hypothetical protein
LYASPNTIKVKGDEMGGACNMHRKGEKHKILVRKPEEKGQLKDMGIDGRIILN